MIFKKQRTNTKHFVQFTTTISDVKYRLYNKTGLYRTIGYVKVFIILKIAINKAQSFIFHYFGFK